MLIPWFLMLIPPFLIFGIEGCLGFFLLIEALGRGGLMPSILMERGSDVVVSGFVCGGSDVVVSGFVCGSSDVVISGFVCGGSSRPLYVAYCSPSLSPISWRTLLHRASKEVSKSPNTKMSSRLTWSPSWPFMKLMIRPISAYVVCRFWLLSESCDSWDSG